MTLQKKKIWFFTPPMDAPCQEFFIRTYIQICLSPLGNGETAEILEIGFENSSSIHPLNPNLRNKDKVGAWCKDFGNNDYGIIDK